MVRSRHSPTSPNHQEMKTADDTSMEGSIQIREIEKSDVEAFGNMIRIGLNEVIPALLKVQCLRNRKFQCVVVFFSFTLGFAMKGDIASFVTAFIFSILITVAFGWIFLRFHLKYQETRDLESDIISLYHKIWIAEIRTGGRRKMIGSIALKEAVDGHSKIEIKRVSVLRKFRQLGVAFNLVKHATEYAKKKGFQEVFLTYSENQEPARKLYEKSGFKHKVDFQIEMLMGLLSIKFYKVTKKLNLH